MRKKYAVVFAALVIGLSVCPLDVAARGSTDVEIVDTTNTTEAGGDEAGTGGTDTGDGEAAEAGKTPEDDGKSETGTGKTDTGDEEGAEIGKTPEDDGKSEASTGKTDTGDAEGMDTGETPEDDGKSETGTGEAGTGDVETAETPKGGKSETDTGNADAGTIGGKEAGESETDTKNVEGKESSLTENMPKLEDNTRLSLQIPQKLEVVIDPFEMEGRGQIYSEQYTIRNTGETAGVLTLSFSCKLGNDSSLKLWKEADGIHSGKRKSVYMKVMFGEKESLTLSEERSEYQTKLAPGEGVTLYFTGEINENASRQWSDGDVKIEGIYAWNETEETLPEEDEETGTDADEEADEILLEDDIGADAAGETEETLPEESKETEADAAGEAGETLPEENESTETSAAGKAEEEVSDGGDESAGENSAEEEASGETKELKENVPQQSEEDEGIEEIPDKGLKEENPGKGEEEDGKEEKNNDSLGRGRTDSGHSSGSADVSAV